MSNMNNSLKIYHRIQNDLEEDIKRLNSNIKEMKQISSDIKKNVGGKKEKMSKLNKILKEEIYHTVSINFERIDDIKLLPNSNNQPKKLTILREYAPQDYFKKFSKILKTANDIFKEHFTNPNEKLIETETENYIIYQNGNIHFKNFNSVGVAARTLGTKVRRKIKKKKSKKDKSKKDKSKKKKIKRSKNHKQ